MNQRQQFTHAELVERAEAYLWSAGCGLVLREFGTLYTSEIPDVIGWRATISMVIECKASRSDFLADARKPFRATPEAGMGNWRFYLTPPYLVQPQELPAGWGLLEVRGRRIYCVHGQPPGNTRLESRAPFQGTRVNLQAERQVLYSALRRLTKRGHLPAVYERIG